VIAFCWHNKGLSWCMDTTDEADATFARQEWHCVITATPSRGGSNSDSQAQRITTEYPGDYLSFLT